MTEPDRAADLDVAQLGATSTRAAAVTVFSHAAQLIVGVVGTMILARLLRPSDFGLWAMVVSIAGFVIAVRDFGLPMAAIQRPQISDPQLSGLFWLNVRLSALLCGGLAAIAPLVAWFYREPRLTLLMLALAAAIFVNCLGMLHLGLLRRQMRFAAVMWIEIVALLAGVGAGIAAALAHLGVWSLLIQQIAVYLVQTIGAAIAYPWWPLAASQTPDAALTSMRRYGRYLTATRALAYIGRNVSEVLIGRTRGPFQLGLYDKAEQWAILPFMQIYTPMLNVAVASFSRLQDDVERYRSYFRRSLATLCAITFPLLALVMLDAREAILLLFGAQWTDATPIFRLLALATLIGSVTQAARWIYLAEGQTHREFRWTMFATPVLIAAIAIGVTCGGATGVAGGITIATALLAYPSVRYAIAHSKLAERDIWQPAWRPALFTAIAALIVWQVRLYAPIHPTSALARIVFDALLIATGYLACWCSTRSNRAELVELLRPARHFLPARHFT